MLGSTSFAPELIITDEVLGSFADELCKVLVGHIWWSNRIFEEILDSFEEVYTTPRPLSTYI